MATSCSIFRENPSTIDTPNQTGDSDASPPPKKHPNPRHVRGGRPRRKKLPGLKKSIDGYENSGHENLSDFLFTDGDQSALEEDSPSKITKHTFDKRSEGAADATKQQPQSLEVGAYEVVEEMANLSVTGGKEDMDQATNGEDPIELENNQQQQQNTPQDMQTPTKKKSARKRLRRKKSKTPNKQEDEVDNEVDIDPHEDEDDYPSNIGSPSTPHPKNPEQDPSPTKVTRAKAPERTLEEELSFLTRVSPTKYIVQPGFVPNMKVAAEIIVNDDLENLLIQELRDTCCGPKRGDSSFIPALRQAANVAALPGIVKASLAMPDVHSGYGFCIGNVAAFDMDDPDAVISPGGVGFDINCGVRLIRTNLTEKDVDEETREKLAEALFRNIPVGVGVDGGIPCERNDLDNLLENGIDWAIKKGYAWEEDKSHCEENGRMETADSKNVSSRAKKRGLKQLGTLGAGNHYAEVQIVDEIYHPEAAEAMGINTLGQVCIMIHTGSRGLGHQVATDALTKMENAMARDHIDLNDRQLSCARISSREGKEYLGEFDANVIALCTCRSQLISPFSSSSCHVCCCQLCMGKSILHHISCTKSLFRSIQARARRFGHAPSL